MPDPGAGPHAPPGGPDGPAAAPRAARLRPLAGWLAWALVLVLLDQATKAWISGALGYGQRIAVLPPVFDLTLLHNTGAAFSFLAGGGGAQRWLFTGIAAAAAVLILRWLYTHATERLLCAALASILGGAVGNAIDRLQHGHVVDFLLFYWRDWYFPAFNLADVAITCGAVLLILDEILRARRARPS
jgi:signal peptidase II